MSARWLIGLGLGLALCQAAAGPMVIAHRGASGYLPEHTLPAKAMAHAMGADYIEQDVVLTRDGVPVVLHDIHLDTVSDVAEVFPDRARDDGRWYVLDFTLAELRRLTLTERFDRETGRAVFPDRFPIHRSRFEIATLAEEIELIQGLNRSTGREAGLYVEIKDPAWHREQGRDISPVVLAMLADYGYTDRDDRIFLQCFDWAETRRLREALGWRGRLVQLLGENRWQMNATDYDHLKTPAGLAEIARVADGIGPWIGQILAEDADGPQPTGLVETAHAAGLLVHAYTLRADALPDYAPDFDTLLGWVFRDAGVDGAFTDFPDRVLDYLRRAGLR